MRNLQYGGRGIGNAVEYYFLTPLGREIAFESIRAGERIRLTGHRRGYSFHKAYMAVKTEKE